MVINFNPKYIPGDIVYNHKKEIIRITSSYLKGTKLFYYRDGNYGWIREDAIKPIPLTPEILKKNGWDKLNKIPINCTILYKSHQGLMIGYNINSKTFIYDFGVNLQRKIKFIHQLQHLLFGLGLNSDMEV